MIADDPMRAQLERLLRQGRDEDALDYLRLPCWKQRDPWSLILQEQRLQRRYKRALGDLARAPVRGPVPERRLSTDESSLLRHCDGETSLAEIIRRSGLDRFAAMRGLHGLVDGGVLTVPLAKGTVSSPAALGVSQPARHGTHLLLLACLLVVALVALVGWSLTGIEPPSL